MTKHLRFDSPEELAFLATELGFQPPRSRWVGHDYVTEYIRGDVRITISWDGAEQPLGGVHVGEQFIGTANLSPAGFAEVIRRHPEVLQGEFLPMEQAEIAAERQLRYADHPGLADVERAFREQHGNQPGVWDVICRREPVRQVDHAVFVMQTPGLRRPRLPKTFRDYRVYRLSRSPQGYWMQD